MGLVNGLLTTSDGNGISIGDISNCIGLVSNDLWVLYNSSMVKWGARYKPVPWNGNVNPQGAHPNDWQKGIDGDYGIKSNTLKPSEAANIKNIVDGSWNGWSYVRDNRAARILDFNGYYHAAQSPFGTLHTESQYTIPNYAPGEDVKIRVDGNVVSSGTYQLSVFGDIKVLGYYGGSERTQLLEVQKLYIGFVIYYYYNNAWTFQRCVILSDKLEDLNPPHLYNIGPFVKPGPIANWPVNYRVYAALFDTNTVSSESGLPTNGYNIVPVPGWNYQDITITETVGPGVVSGSIETTVDYDDYYGTYNNYGNFECYIKGNDHYTTNVAVKVTITLNGTVIKTLYNNTVFTINPGQTARVGKADDNLVFNQSGTDIPPSTFYIPGYTAEQIYDGGANVNIYLDNVLKATQRFYRTH